MGRPNINIMKPLSDAVLTLKTPQEVYKFLRDLLTPAELKEFEARWEIAQMLDEEKLSYRDIAEKAGTSTTTVTRVARFLRNEPHQGYRITLDRLSKSRKK